MKYLSLMVICLLANCAKDEKQSATVDVAPATTDGEVVDGNADSQVQFEALYEEWERDVQEKLDAGYSGIYGNRKLVNEIGAVVHSHEKYLFEEKLVNHMFAYELLDASEILLEKYQMERFKGGVVQTQQKAWMEAYSKHNNFLPSSLTPWPPSGKKALSLPIQKTLK